MNTKTRKEYHKIKDKYNLSTMQIEEIAQAYIKHYEFLACDLISNECLALNYDVRIKIKRG